MKLMISVLSAAEAQEALAGGAEILDVKNPAEGSLGAQFPRVIREVKSISPESVKVSAAIGDMPNLPGTAALAALGAASCGADYIKVGLYGSSVEADALTLLQEVQEAVGGFPAQVIAGAYVDFKRVGALDLQVLPRLAAAAGVGGCLVDTAIKDGSNLFDFISAGSLRSLAEEAHALGLLFGVAGALSEDQLSIVQALGADVVGVRTAVCRDGRRAGPLDAERVARLHSSITKAGYVVTT
jgi:uncharacterized protein (UPF0264 family)